MTRRIAVVDIGTNTVLMLVAECTPGEAPRVLEERAEIVRLGQGVDQTGKLDPEAIARAVATCKRYGDIARGHKAEVFAIGTQALREVRNATAFLGPALPALGGDIEIVSGKREADLAYRAVRGSFPELAASCLVVDVGGGSTEILHAKDGVVVDKLSTKLGAVRLHERFCKSDLPSDAEWAALCAHIEETLPKQLPGGLPLVGIAGTVTTLAAIQGGVAPYDAARVHGSRLAVGEIVALTDRLRRMPHAERLGVAGLEPARADVIDAGAAIVERVLLRHGGAELIVSDRGVRWGLLYEKLDALPA